MTDADIVALYWARDEQAIAQTAQKFGAYCRKIAMNLLGSQEDAEECENDTWMAAWNSMPQNRPDKLAPYLGRITRNLALDLRERQNAKKRGGGQTWWLPEIFRIIPYPSISAAPSEWHPAISVPPGV